MSRVSVAALSEFLDRQDLGSGTVSIERVGDGHSLQTFRVRRSGLDAILRMPPPVLSNARAHDVSREVMVLEGLKGSGVRAPQVLAACDESALLGAPFELISFVPGVVIGAALPARLGDRDRRRRVGEELVDALVELHGFEWCDGALSSLSRVGDEYLRRQLDVFERVSQTDAPRAISGLGELTQDLRATVPDAGDTTLIHGDYRLGNVLFSIGDSVRLRGILDWETAALGDPLTDLGYMLATYAEPGDGDGILLSLSGATSRPGFMLREEIADRYAERSGRSIERLQWYVAFSQWKVAIILEGLYRQHLRGEADDRFYGELEHGVPELVTRAAEALGRDRGHWLAG